MRPGLHAYSQYGAPESLHDNLVFLDCNAKVERIFVPKKKCPLESQLFSFISLTVTINSHQFFLVSIILNVAHNLAF